MNQLIAIAIDKYSDTNIDDLKSCYNGIDAIIGTFTDAFHFDRIEFFHEPEQTTLSFIYNRLYDYLINAFPDDKILIVFAGHGEYNQTLQTSYWLTTEAFRHDASGWFNITTLIDFMRVSKANHISLISDSCFAGAIFEEKSRGGGTAAIEDKKSRTALTSGGVEKVGDGVDGHPNAFTEALIKTVKESTSEMTFLSLSEKTTINFDPEKRQTPTYGVLNNAGHEGGDMLFESNLSKGIYQDMSLPFEVDPEIKLNYSCSVPFFRKNTRFNSEFVNAFIQQMGYRIINETRLAFMNNKEYFVEKSNEYGVSLDIHYNLSLLNGKFLSMTLTQNDYFGGAHPNTAIFSLNIAFQPERVLSFDDLIDYSSYRNFRDFLLDCIQKYSGKDARDSLLEHYMYASSHNLVFYFNDEVLTIDFVNIMPRAVMAHAFLSIPTEVLKFKI